ncbi:MAG: dehypoxanthine futalosine cyclase [Candidatus Schekmanbacteria bacterium]|nr:MAG: dehypoxanthine futalosine cyclase [Candidatus Schekmanbacteria bacterium]
MINERIEKIENEKRIDKEEAILLYEKSDLHLLGRLAHNIRLKKTDSSQVSYIVDRNINFTNICVSGCAFCAFYKKPDEEGGFLLSNDEIYNKIDEAIKKGASRILMQGGLNPNLGLDYYEKLLKGIKERFKIHIHSFSPPEIVFIAEKEKISTSKVLRHLKDAGLDSIPGGGAEILVEETRRKISPHKCSGKQWIEVMREAHKLKMPTTATMMFGHIESIKDRVFHLERIRELQDETGGFTAFIPWTFQWKNTKLGEFKASSFEYLKTLALSRIYLDNIKNIQSSWVTQGAKVAQLSLFFGANDLGGTMMEENVVRMAGATFRMDEDEIVNLIERAGFVPVRRDNNYKILEIKGGS